MMKPSADCVFRHFTSYKYRASYARNEILTKTIRSIVYNRYIEWCFRSVYKIPRVFQLQFLLQRVTMGQSFSSSLQVCHPQPYILVTKKISLTTLKRGVQCESLFKRSQPILQSTHPTRNMVPTTPHTGNKKKKILNKVSKQVQDGRIQNRKNVREHLTAI